MVCGTVRGPDRRRVDSPRNETPDGKTADDRSYTSYRRSPVDRTLSGRLYGLIH